jgi:CsoR family transcriptional regulator, copper-sensing transcriptional repressor
MMPTPTSELIAEAEVISEVNSEPTAELTTEVMREINSQEMGVTDEAARLRAEEKAKIINRLRRLEGQVRGLQRMVEEERSCQEVLTLLSGVRSALNATADRVLVNYLEHCQIDVERGEADIQELVKAVKLARG